MHPTLGVRAKKVLAAELMPERRRAEVRDSDAIRPSGVRPGALGGSVLISVASCEVSSSAANDTDRGCGGGEDPLTRSWVQDAVRCARDRRRFPSTRSSIRQMVTLDTRRHSIAAAPHQLRGPGVARGVEGPRRGERSGPSYHAARPCRDRDRGVGSTVRGAGEPGDSRRRRQLEHGRSGVRGRHRPQPPTGKSGAGEASGTGTCTVRMFAARGDFVSADFGPLVFARVEST